MKRFRQTRLGFTLVEIVVSSFVLSLLLLVSVRVLIPALRAWSEGQKRSEIYQGLLVTTNWIGDDIIRSSPKSIKRTEEGILVMSCALGTREDHNNEFKELVAYYLQGKELFRTHKTLESGTTAPLDLSIADLESFHSKRRVASGVETFEVTVIQPWRAELNLLVERDGRSAEIKTSFTSIYAPFDPNIAEKVAELEAEAEEP